MQPVFGVDPKELRALVQEKVGEFNALSEEDVDLLDQYKSLTERCAELQKAEAGAKTEEEKAEVESQLREIESERDTVLQRLGFPGK